jgi:hypothetical protein
LLATTAYSPNFHLAIFPKTCVPIFTFKGSELVAMVVKKPGKKKRPDLTSFPVLIMITERFLVNLFHRRQHPFRCHWHLVKPRSHCIENGVGNYTAHADDSRFAASLWWLVAIEYHDLNFWQPRKFWMS